MTSEDRKSAALKRWSENLEFKSGRSRGLILENWAEAIDSSWSLGKNGWHVMGEKNVPEKFDFLVIENISSQLIKSDGTFRRSESGKFVPTDAQTILAAATLAVRLSKPILVSTIGRFGSLKKINVSEIDLADLDVGGLLAGEELLYLLQSYCETTDDDPKSQDSTGAIYMTPIERQLAKLMRKNRIEFKAQVPVGRYFADFLIGEKLVVECDGEAWHDPEIDQKRDADLFALGFRTLRITGRAINNDPKSSVQRIKSETAGQNQYEFFEAQGLTIPQKRAATHWNGPILVVAPAGSGKTKVVAERIKYLVSRGALPERICAISFTNAAVGEIADRILGIDGVKTTTLHSLAFQICKAHIGDRSVVQNVKSPNVPTRSDILRQALVKVGMTQGRFGQSKAMLDAIEHYRNSLEVPNLEETVLAEDSQLTHEERSKKFLDLHSQYEFILNSRRLTDFDGMVLDAVRVLQRNEQARMIWSRKFDYWMVDEFQDLARPKLMLLRLLVSPARNLMAVGDDDQIIYGFAGSKPEIFSILNRDWRDMTPLPLDINFRCPHDLVVRSQWLIQNNKLRIPKTITANRELSVTDNIQVFSNDAYERLAVDKIIEEIKGGRTPSDIALLFRVSMAAAPVEMLLQKNGIKFVSLAKNSLLHNPTIKWLRSWLKVVNRSSGEEDWKTVFHRPRRYLSAETVNWLTSFDERGVIDPDSRIDLGIQDPSLMPRKNETQTDDLLVDSLVELRRNLRDARAVGDSPSRQLRMLMLDVCLSKEEDERLERNLQATNSSRRAEMGGTSVDPIVAYQIFYSLAEASEGFLDLEDWFHRAGVDQDISFFETSDQGANANDRVILSTVHGFKGKEKPVIFVLGPEGAMPDRRAKSEVELEEERRIAYVSVTRAREKLYFAASSQYSRELSWSQSGESWSQYRQKHDRTEPTVVSTHQYKSAPSASTEKKPGTLDRILNWFLKLLDI